MINDKPVVEYFSNWRFSESKFSADKNNSKTTSEAKLPTMEEALSGKASDGLFASTEDIAKFISAGLIGNYCKNHDVQ